MAAIALDHVFVFAAPGGPERRLLEGAGMRIGRERRHPGQGTANACVFFADLMLELIWIDDEREARSPLVAPLRLWERAHWRDTGASPFGVCLRLDRDEPTMLPFPTVPYAPPYLPAGIALHVATDAPPELPLLFAVTAPWSPPPPCHALATTRVARCELRAPLEAEGSQRLRGPLPSPLLFAAGEPHLQLTLQAAPTRGAVDLAPLLPVDLRW